MFISFSSFISNLYRESSPSLPKIGKWFVSQISPQASFLFAVGYCSTIVSFDWKTQSLLPERNYQSFFSVFRLLIGLRIYASDYRTVKVIFDGNEVL